MRRVGIDHRRIRAKQIANALWETSEDGAPVLLTYTVGEAALTRQGLAGIYRCLALASVQAALVAFAAGESRARRRYSPTACELASPRIFRGRRDGVGIALTLRWSLPRPRYGTVANSKSATESRRGYWRECRAEEDRQSSFDRTYCSLRPANRSKSRTAPRAGSSIMALRSILVPTRLIAI